MAAFGPPPGQLHHLRTAGILSKQSGPPHNSYFMQSHTLRRLIAFTRSNSSLVESAVSTARLCTPALLNAASRCPNADTGFSTILFNLASSMKSQVIAIGLWPSVTHCSHYFLHPRSFE